jgi:hypothetical protein
MYASIDAGASSRSASDRRPATEELFVEGDGADLADSERHIARVRRTTGFSSRVAARCSTTTTDGSITRSITLDTDHRGVAARELDLGACSPGGA